MGKGPEVLTLGSSSDIKSYPTHFLAQAWKIKKIHPGKKSLIYSEMKLSSSIIKENPDIFLYFGKMKPQKILYIWENGTFRARKMKKKKKKILKFFLYFRKRNVLAPSLQNSCSSLLFRCFHFTIDFLCCVPVFSLLIAFFNFTNPRVFHYCFFSCLYFTADFCQISLVWRFFVKYFDFVVARVLRIWESIFYSQALFTLHSFPTFGTNRFYQDFPGSRQFFLEGCKVSHWGSKHRPGPSVCLNQKMFSKRY